MINLDEQQQKTLEDLLLKIKSNLDKKGKVFFIVLNKSQRSRQELIKKSSVTEDTLGLSYLERQQLLENNLISLVSASERLYAISIKGLIVTEFGITKVSANVEQFLDEINREYLEKSKNKITKPLKDVEKTLLFLMLGLRSISRETYLDLNKGPLKEAFEETSFFLNKNKFIKTNPAEHYSGAKSEEPFRATLRRLNELPLKSESIYSFSGHGKVFLDLYSEGQLLESRIKFIFNKILGKEKVTFREKENIGKFLRRLYEKYAHQMYSSKIFSSSDINDFGDKMEEFILLKL
jgi:hypothetical protein